MWEENTSAERDLRGVRGHQLREGPAQLQAFASARAVISHCRRVRFSVTPWTVALQAPLSMGFSRCEYWSGLPCPPPGDLPDPGIKLVSTMSPTLAGGFITWDTP